MKKEERLNIFEFERVQTLIKKEVAFLNRLQEKEKRPSTEAEIWFLSSVSEHLNKLRKGGCI